MSLICHITKHSFALPLAKGLSVGTISPLRYCAVTLAGCMEILCAGDGRV